MTFREHFGARCGPRGMHDAYTRPPDGEGLISRIRGPGPVIMPHPSRANRDFPGRGRTNEMARYSGGITTHRALTGPRKLPYMHSDEKAYKFEVLATLQAVKSIREACDLTEMRAVRRPAGSAPHGRRSPPSSASTETPCRSAGRSWTPNEGFRVRRAVASSRGALGTVSGIAFSAVRTTSQGTKRARSPLKGKGERASRITELRCRGAPSGDKTGPILVQPDPQ